MEGPSVVIATEEFAPYFGMKIVKAMGSARLPFKDFKGAPLLEAKSWGKHFIFDFQGYTLLIHFLMFGSYRINDPRKNRDLRCS